MIRFANIKKAEKILSFKISRNTFDVINGIIAEFNNKKSKFYIKN